MYNNKVIYILKDTSGNTVGAEVEFNGKTYKLRTAELKSRKFNFINATVDKNGYVRARSGSLPKKKYTDQSKVLTNKAVNTNAGSLPKKKYKAPSKVSTPNIQVNTNAANLTKKAPIDTRKPQEQQLLVTKSKITDGIRLTVGKPDRRFLVLVEDEKGGLLLYEYFIEYLLRSNIIGYLNVDIDIQTSHGRNSIVGIVRKSKGYQGYIVVVDRLGAYRKINKNNTDETDETDVIRMIRKVLITKNIRSGLFAPLSAEFCVATLSYLYSDLSSKRCKDRVPAWFLDYLLKVNSIFKDGGLFINVHVDKNSLETERVYINSDYEDYSKINGELPNLEKQVTKLLWAGLRKTHFKYESKRLSDCLYLDCCYGEYLKRVTDTKCGKTGANKSKMKLWEEGSCLGIFKSVFESVVLQSSYAEYKKSDIINEVYGR